MPDTSDTAALTITAVGNAIQKPTQKPLDGAELAERLKGLPSNVVENIFTLVKSQIDVEAGRQSRLDTKTTSLLSAAGFALPVALTFGGLILTHHLASKTPGWIALSFGLALLAALTAAAFAIAALFVRDRYRAVNEDALFGQGVLNRVREVAGSGEQQQLDAAKSEFMMSMTIHLWSIVQKHRENHLKKAWLVKGGQLALAVFLGALFVVFGLVVYGAYPHL